MLLLVTWPVRPVFTLGAADVSVGFTSGGVVGVGFPPYIRCNCVMTLSKSPCPCVVMSVWGSTGCSSACLMLSSDLAMRPAVVIIMTLDVVFVSCCQAISSCKVSIAVVVSRSCVETIPALVSFVGDYIL